MAVGDSVDPARIGERVIVRTMQNWTDESGETQVITLGSERHGAFAQFMAARSFDAVDQHQRTEQLVDQDSQLADDRAAVGDHALLPRADTCCALVFQNIDRQIPELNPPYNVSLPELDYFRGWPETDYVLVLECKKIML